MRLRFFFFIKHSFVLEAFIKKAFLPMQLTWFLGQISVEHVCQALFLSSLVHSTDLFVYPSTCAYTTES